MDANNTNPPRRNLRVCFKVCSGSTSWGDDAGRGPWRLRLLAKFLTQKYAKQETASTQEHVEMGVQNQVMITLDHHEDILFKILTLVPAESLVRLQFVCKKWFNLINSSFFIGCHINAQQSKTTLISQRLTFLKPGSFPYLPPQFEVDEPKSYFHLLELNHGGDMNNFIESSIVDDFVDVRASYDGLVLATVVDKKINKSLILMNPVTRRHTALPLGTVVPMSRDEAYGIAFCSEANTYKVVHLFQEKLVGYTGAEILCITTRKWTRMEGPPSELVRYTSQTLVSIGGSLYWIPRQHSSDDFVSLNVNDEKFVTKKLPVICGLNDRLLDIGGSLGLVARVGVDRLQVWVLSTNNMNWVMQHSIHVNVVGVRYANPICSSRKGKEMVFQSPSCCLYIYDFETYEMKLMVNPTDDVEDDDDGVWFGQMDKLYIPHLNSLASWDHDHHQVIC